MNERAKKVLDFWFVESKPEDWFKKSDDFDRKIKNLFWYDHQKAIKNEYDEWQDEIDECVALVIILDQFSRNLFRESPKAYEQDYKSRLIVNEGIDRGYLEHMEINKIHFFLLPLIHSEDISDHIFGHKLVDAYLKDHGSFKKIKKVWDQHTVAIKKYGRYPHRNKTLERKSTNAENKFLNKPNSSW